MYLPVILPSHYKVTPLTSTRYLYTCRDS